MLKKLKLIFNIVLFIVLLTAPLSSADTIRLYPTSDVSIGNWLDQGGGSTNLYSTVDETSENTADYIKTLNNKSGSVDTIILFGWTQVSPTLGTISKITFYAQAQFIIEGGNPASTKQIFFCSKNASYQSSAKNLTTSDALYSADFTTSDGVNAWTPTSINAMQSGIRGYISQDGVNYGHIDIYQTYIDVVYTPAAAGGTQRKVLLFH